MNARTTELDNLMRDHKLTARQVGDMLGRKPHTVRCWRSTWDGRTIPEHSLLVLKMHIASRARGSK